MHAACSGLALLLLLRWVRWGEGEEEEEEEEEVVMVVVVVLLLLLLHCRAWICPCVCDGSYWWWMTGFLGLEKGVLGKSRNTEHRTTAKRLHQLPRSVRLRGMLRIRGAW